MTNGAGPRRHHSWRGKGYKYAPTSASGYGGSVKGDYMDYLDREIMRHEKAAKEQTTNGAKTRKMKSGKKSWAKKLKTRIATTPGARSAWRVGFAVGGGGGAGKK